MIGLPLQQVVDTVELPVRETEQAMEGLFGDCAQRASV